jgi:diguanylate cyclase (GGDEF)-like protein
LQVEPAKIQLHPVPRTRWLAAAAACGLAALIGLPGPAGAARSTAILDGSSLDLADSPTGLIGQSAGSPLPAVTVDPGSALQSLPELGLGGAPPADGSPSPPAAQPTSLPPGQAGPESGAPRPRPRTTPGTQTGATTDARKGGGATSDPERASSGGLSVAGSRARADALARKSQAAAGSGPSPGKAGSRGSHKRSIATRIVDRVPPEYQSGLLALAAIAVLFGLLSLHESRRSRRAREDALVDSLTGLANREGFEQRIESEWRRALRYERDVGLLMLDLDGFKEINDTHGHMEGDRVLKEAAAAISGRIRETDFASRFGGDEFVVLCPETADHGLKTLADGLEETLRRHRIRASAGFSQREPSDSSPDDLIARADAAMYRRKRELPARAAALVAAEA